MQRPKIYHNPRCGKSRQALTLLQERLGGEDSVDVILYLQNPPSGKELKALLKKLGLPARSVLRKQEPPYKQLDLATHLDDESLLIGAICQNPILLERPIVVLGNRAEIGRPPENVLRLLAESP